MSELRPELPELPERIRALPVDDRGYPVPWFVAWVDGKPDHRIVDQPKIPEAINRRLCWVCGQTLGGYLAFPIGPMCAVTRTSAEPPSHRECAEFAARACPFLTRPHAKRRETGLPDNAVEAAGNMIKRNPGVAGVWVTKRYRIERVPGGIVFQIGEPVQVVWFAEGRPATRAEVEESLNGGVQILREQAEREPDSSAVLVELERRVRAARVYLPCEPRT